MQKYSILKGNTGTELNIIRSFYQAYATKIK